MDQKTAPITAEAICDKIGRQAIASRVGRSITAVSNASASGKFPAQWYLAIRDMCREVKQDCPDEAFSFIADVIQINSAQA